MSTYGKFSVSYNQQVLNGWVKQPSPCCAAAAVAGAYNALMGRHRADENALNYAHIIDLYKQVCFPPSINNLLLNMSIDHVTLSSDNERADRTEEDFLRKDSGLCFY